MSKPLTTPKVLSSDFVSFTNLNMKAEIGLLFPASLCVLNLGEIFLRQPDSPLLDEVKLLWNDNCSELTIGSSVHTVYHQTSISKRILKLREAQMILAVDVLGFQIQLKGIGPA